MGYTATAMARLSPPAPASRRARFVLLAAGLAAGLAGTPPAAAQLDDTPAGPVIDRLGREALERLGPALDDDPTTGPTPLADGPRPRLLGLPDQPPELTALEGAAASGSAPAAAGLAPPRRVPPARPATLAKRYPLQVAGKTAGEIAVREGKQSARLWVSLAELTKRGDEAGVAVHGAAGFAGGDPQGAPIFHLAATPARLYQADRPGEARTVPAAAVLPMGDDLFVRPQLASTLLGRQVSLDGAAERARLAAAPAQRSQDSYRPPRPPPQPPQGPGADLQLHVEGPLGGSPSPDLPRAWASATLDGTSGPWGLAGQLSARGTAGSLAGTLAPGGAGTAELDRLSLTLARDLPHGAVGSATLLPRRVAAGDVLPATGPLGAGAPPERGLAVTSLPRHRYPDLRRLHLRGPARPGSTVLAFQDGRLLDHERVGLDGRYGLGPVGLPAGESRLTRLAVTNTGRYRPKTRQLDLGSATLVPGTADYSLSLTQTGAPLVPTDPAPVGPSLALPGGGTDSAPAEGGIHAAGRATVPITPHLRTDLSAELAETATSTQAAAELSATQRVRGGLVDLGLTTGPRGRLGGSLGLRLAPGPWRLGVRQGLADASRQAGPYGAVVDRPSATTALDAIWRAPGEATQSVGLHWQRRRRGPAVTQRYRAVAGVESGGERLSLELRGAAGNAAAANRWAAGTRLGLFLPFERSTVLAVADARLAESQGSGIAGYGALHRRLGGGFGAALLARSNRQPRRSSELGGRLTWSAGGLRTGFQASRTTEGTTRLGLSLTARVGAAPTRTRGRTSRSPDLDRGAARAALRYGPGAAPPGRRPRSPVVGARVTADRLKRSGRTDRRGAALVPNLPPGQPVRLRVDSRSLDLPKRQRARPEHRDVTAAIGEAPRVDFRVEANGTVSGTLRLRRRGGEAVPAAGLPVVLRQRGNAQPAQTAHSAADGTFSFDGVPPGRYTVGVAESATRQLGYRPGLRRPLKLARTGAAAPGQAIYLGPPGGTEGKRGPAPREIGSKPAVAVNAGGQPAARDGSSGDPGAARPESETQPDAGLRPEQGGAQAPGGTGTGSLGLPGESGNGQGDGASGTTASASQAPAPSGSVVLFLGDYPDASARTVAWFGLKQRFGKALADLQQLPAERARQAVGAQALPKGAQAPLYAGPLDDRARAREICKRLQQGRQFCSLRPPGERS